MRLGAMLVACALVSCSPPERSRVHHEVAPAPRVAHRTPSAASPMAPSCAEVDGRAWPRAADGFGGVVRAAGSALVQKMHDGRDEELAFVGAHTFDLLNKLHEEAATEADRRRVVCAVLNDAASRGVRVLRLWGSLKRTGSAQEVERATKLLALVFDENARRQRPLRFVVTLLNHQAGYGAPDPTRSLDDQAPGVWHASTLYLQDGWRAPGGLADRVAAIGDDPVLASPYVIGWELVNELDTFRHIDGGRFDGAGGNALREAFLVPAAIALARAVPQPVWLGDLRGDREAYAAWAPSVIAALPAWVRARLVWTSHVYAQRGRDVEDFLRKLDVDSAIASTAGLPLVIGEVGQHVPDASAAFCGPPVSHDLGPLLGAIEARGHRALIVWGEGRCQLAMPSMNAMTIGAGADSAELGSDTTTLALLHDLRARW